MDSSRSSLWRCDCPWGGELLRIRVEVYVAPQSKSAALAGMGSDPPQRIDIILHELALCVEDVFNVCLMD